jgi:CHAT domain-containing protein
VNDLSTAFLMLKFYENFQSSQKQAGDVAIALNQAQQWLRNLTIEEFEKLLDQYKPQIQQLFAQMPIKKERIKARRRLEALKRQSHPFASPFYWAAFTATGL